MTAPGPAEVSAPTGRDMSRWAGLLTALALAPALLAGCTTGPGLWACDVSLAILEGASCEINCNTKYGHLGRENYAYQRCLYDCREADNKNKCTRVAEEAKKNKTP